MQIDVTSRKGNNSVQLMHGPVPLGEGQWYELHFWARADTDCTINAAAGVFLPAGYGRLYDQVLANGTSRGADLSARHRVDKTCANRG